MQPEFLTEYDESKRYYNIDRSATGFDAVQKLGQLEHMPNSEYIPYLGLLGTYVYIINFVGQIEKVRLTGILYHNDRIMFQYKYHFGASRIFLAEEEAQNHLKTIKGE